MKNLFIVAVAAIMSVGTANAQRFGITGGVNVSTVKAECNDPETDFTDDIRNLTGFNAGIKADYNFKKTKLGSFCLEGSFLYSRLGYKVINSYDYETKYSYLQLPVNFGYNFNIISNKFTITPKAGIYLGFGIAGEYNELDNLGDSYYRSDPFRDGEYWSYEDKRFDFGFGTGINFEFYKQFQLCLGYQWGCVDICKSEWDDDFSWKNRNLHINIAYMFDL